LGQDCSYDEEWLRSDSVQISAPEGGHHELL
jgi:hypothetical protein